METDAELLSEERQLIPSWSPELVILSYIISWLGAYTSTQIFIHSKYQRKTVSKWLWALLASLSFGFSSIWSMHFVGMLACRLDVSITFDVPLTIFSALVAVIFTFVALSSAYMSERIENSKMALAFSRWTNTIWDHLLSILPGRQHDIEAGYIPISSASDAGVDMDNPEEANVAAHHDEDDEDDEVAIEHGPEEGGERDVSPHRRNRTASFDVPHSLSEEHYQLPVIESEPHSPASMNSSMRHNLGHSTIDFPYAPPISPRRTTFVHSSSQDPLPSTSNPNHRHHSDGDSTPSDSITDDSSSNKTPARSRSNSGTATLFSLSDSNSSPSWNESLRAGLSRETRLRIKAQARDRPPPKLGWRYWAKAHYESISFLLFVRSVVWALAIVFMHYSGMWAMQIPEGHISWNLRIAALSYLVAFIVSFVACLAMIHMEINMGRQVAFSTIAAAGVCSMHYTGMAAATFYTRSPPSPNPGYPIYLPFIIVTISVFVCVISNVVLAHAAIISRNRMAEMILTKRRLWRIMAEKEAAEQANELKQQFISVASHEIRTPLHAVNGYCELLAMTNLTEEQRLYVSSIQQACHAINVIAGNVLDFSKLDRNNVELSARPVLVDLRKMVENVARITNTKNIVMQPGQPSIDMIVSVADDVPQDVYLDETYTFRVLMNLLSNAQKFCESGYICVTVNMDSTTPNQVVVRVIDTGCGIPSSFRSALFQPFRQADTSLTRPRQGTGLGLSIVKHLLQRMNGSIDVESVEGEGTTFSVKLPVTTPPEESNDSSPPRMRPRERKRIKVVYAHPKTARLFVELLNGFGYDACLGSVSASASEIARDADGIWTDVQSVKSSAGLRELMTNRNFSISPSNSNSTANSIPTAPSTSTLNFTSPSLPPINSRPTIYLIHTDTIELSSLEPTLKPISIAEVRGLILVKRPVILHTLLDLIDHPELHVPEQLKTPPVRISGGVGSKVRFVLPDMVREVSEDEERDEEEKERQMSGRQREKGNEGGVQVNVREVDQSREISTSPTPSASTSSLPSPPIRPPTPPRSSSSSSSMLSPNSPPPFASRSRAQNDRSQSRGKSRGKVLLVEDNMVSQQLGKRFLEKLGYEVVVSADGQDAVQKAKNDNFICCLMDCQMPVLDGFAATSQIRELEHNGKVHGHLPIIALTANVSTDNEDRCRAAGMDGFLAKPLKLSELGSVIAQYELHDSPPELENS